MFLEKLSFYFSKEENDYKSILKRSCCLNSIPYRLFSKINLKLAQKNLKFIQNILNNKISSSKIWIENELFLFKWLVTCYSGIQSKLINDFAEEEWILFSELFRNKQIYILKYEVKNLLMSSKSTRRVWSVEQEKILNQIKSQFTSQNKQNKWNQIARLLYHQSDLKYFRLGKHCRQHWIKYLDTSDSISNEENAQLRISQLDIKILKMLLKYGKKWQKIVKRLKVPLKTVKIKNRFNKLLQKVQKQYNLQTNQSSIMFLLDKYDTKTQQQKLEDYQRSDIIKVNQNQPYSIMQHKQKSQTTQKMMSERQNSQDLEEFFYSRQSSFKKVQQNNDNNLCSFFWNFNDWIPNYQNLNLFDLCYPYNAEIISSYATKLYNPYIIQLN